MLGIYFESIWKRIGSDLFSKRDFGESGGIWHIRAEGSAITYVFSILPISIMS